MVTITLEMVDEVRNRTGVDYKTAKEALEQCDGDVLESLIFIENERPHDGKKSEFTNKSNEIIETLKDLINKGVITRIIVEHQERIVMDIPVIAGGIAALVFVPATVAAIITALATGCILKIVKEDGEILNLNEMTSEALKNVVETTEKTVNSFKNKGHQDVKTEEKETVRDEDLEVDVDPEHLKANDEDDDYIVEAKFMEDGTEN